MKSAILPKIIIAILFCSILCAPHILTGQSTQNITGIIITNSTWTRANSPYSLTGPVAVDEGVTLNIEPGVKINLNGFYIQVNGTLRAIGGSAKDISFDNGEIFFYQTSPGWVEGNGLGSIIGNAKLTSIHININHTSPKIDSNSIMGEIHCHESSTIITNNDITGYRAIFLSRSNALIANNTIHSENTGIECLSDKSLIDSNKIYGGKTGIISGSATVLRNTVVGCDVGIDAQVFSTVEKNLILNNNRYGIINRGTITSNNTIANNTVGIYAAEASLIIYNNLENNVEYNLHLNPDTAANIDASENWWGTTDFTIIDQKIYDYNDDFNLGKVTYTPVLTAANPQAIPDSAPIPATPPTLSPSNSPSSTPNSATQNPTATPVEPNSGFSVFLGLDWVGIAVVVLLAVIVVLLVVVVVFLRRRSVG
ncbi:MAG: hypothetical protein ACQCN6_11190 [Candidatus Bathyarchaeia archaeon]|jgi:hypothetical protein